MQIVERLSQSVYTKLSQLSIQYEDLVVNSVIALIVLVFLGLVSYATSYSDGLLNKSLTAVITGSMILSAVCIFVMKKFDINIDHLHAPLNITPFIPRRARLPEK